VCRWFGLLSNGRSRMRYEIIGSRQSQAVCRHEGKVVILGIRCRRLYIGRSAPHTGHNQPPAKILDMLLGRCCTTGPAISPNSGSGTSTKGE
jgi:hypothetical protein